MNAMSHTVILVLAIASALAGSAEQHGRLPATKPPTGKICGVIRDARTNELVTYANVMVIGTTLGAMSLYDGQFSIVGVPEGVHRVKGMMMGYHSSTLDSVVVRSGEETWVSIAVMSAGPSFSDSAVAERSVVGSETRATAADIRVEIHPDNTPFRVGDRPVFRVVLRNVSRETFYLVGAIDNSEEKSRYPHVTMTITGPEGGIAKPGLIGCGNVNPLETGDFVELRPDEWFEPITPPFWSPTDAQYAEFAKPGRFVAKFHYSSDAIDYAQWDGQLNTWPTPESVVRLLKRVPRIVLEDSLEVTVVE